MKTREITTGMNGYPVPAIGRALLITDSADAKKARSFARKYELDIISVHWKNGWHNCESRGNDFKVEPFPSHEYLFDEVYHTQRPKYYIYFDTHHDCKALFLPYDNDNYDTIYNEWKDKK